ncbi:uncharacterized protein LOC143550696 [Bidens hawaiensis]|uniref:uncharacterized protein LOC143550696 n=1 Tax=Bidens hawaiensis TaxID=980011 RepID=UPI00404A4177
MENHAIPAAQIDANDRPVKESRWKRILNEVNGRSERYYKHQVSPLLSKSYAELDRLYSEDGPQDDGTLIGAGFAYPSESILFKMGVSALEFDTKIAYTSSRSSQLTISDIQLSQEVQVLLFMSLQVLRKSSDRETKELSDIAFLNDGMRVLASDTRGVINMWDRRVSAIPQRLLTTKRIAGLTSIQILGDHCVYGDSTTGFIYVWDLRRMRGGRPLPAASLSDWEIHSIPLTSIDLGYLLKQIDPCKIRHDRRPKELYAISINPSCPYQLAFHLDDGCDAESLGVNDEDKRSIFVPLSKNVTACAVHPINGTIVAGAMDASLLTVSQKHIGMKGDGDNDHDVEQS